MGVPGHVAPAVSGTTSRSITVRQPELRSERCLIMQAVIFGILGISELQRRNASPVHCCCASALKAKLAVDETAESEAAKASARPTFRTVVVNSVVIVGSHWPRDSGPVVDGWSMRLEPRADCD